MAGSVNKVILIGNLGKDPEVRSMQSGDRVASFSIATSESWKDKQTGERKTKTEWHNVVIFNQPLVKLAESYMRKGSKVYIEGQLETRKWSDQQGIDRYSTEIVLRPFRGEIDLLDSKDSSRPPQAESLDSYGHQSSKSAPSTKSDNFEDEIPF